MQVGSILVRADVVNVVVTAVLGQGVDLDELGKLKEVLHDSVVYGGRVAYFRSPNIKGMISIFSSGKMISVGTESEEEAFREIEYVKGFLVEKGFVKSTILEPKVQNMVVIANFEENVELEELAREQKIIYEPEQFPGGILRIKEPYKATILLFASGKAVVTGLKSSSQINPTLQKIMNLF